MQYPADQKHQITVSVSPAQPITNLEACAPTVGVSNTTKHQPTGLKTVIVVGGICGLTCGLAGLGGGIAIGESKQNHELDKTKSNLVEAQGNKEAIQREAAACLKRIQGY